ncbi:MAG: Flp family type IVb pilin [Actinomycetota bacterium]
MSIQAGVSCQADRSHHPSDGDTAPPPPNERRWAGQRGASLVEYALLVALIALVTMAALQVLGGTIDSTLDNGASELQDAGS